MGTSTTWPMYSKSLSGSKASFLYSAGAVDMPMWWMKRVWPLGAARATLAAAMVPPAPTVFSTSTVWPSVLPMGMAIRRATASVGPPAANGTTSEIGRSGKVPWLNACVPVPSVKAAAQASSRVLSFNVMVVSLW